MKLTPRTRWLLASPLLLLLLAVLGYVVAGPFLAIHSIRDLVARGQTQELWRFIDFDSPVSYTHLDVYKRQVLSVPVPASLYPCHGFPNTTRSSTSSNNSPLTACLSDQRRHLHQGHP